MENNQHYINGNDGVVITCSAPGKLILFGEHAVVYGKNAIATSLSDLRTTITLKAKLSSHQQQQHHHHSTDQHEHSTTTDQHSEHSDEQQHVIIEEKNDTIINFYAPSIGFSENIKIAYSKILKLFSKKQLNELYHIKYNTLNEINQVEQHLYKPDKDIVEKLVNLTKSILLEKEIGTSVAAIEYNKIISIVSVLYLCLIFYNPLNCKYQFENIDIDLSNTTLPIGAGLGSSAAFSVCLVSACLILFNRINYQSIQFNNNNNINTNNNNINTNTTTDSNDNNIDSNENVLKYINEWSYFVESLIHGTPSGIDNSVSTFGGVISFSQGKIQEFLSPQILPNMRILIVNTRVERNTKLIVQGVRERRETNFEFYEKCLNDIQNISNEYLQQLKINSSQLFSNELRLKMEELIDKNHLLLNDIGTGHSKLDLICTIASKYGLHAKLTGAGGGGCGFILLNNDDSNDNSEELLKQDLTREGFQYFMSNQVAGIGVQCEKYIQH